MRKAISYIRFSSAIQATGSSEARQADDFKAFCKSHNLDPHASFTDQGKSGFKGHHRKAQFGEFLAQCKSGQFPKGSVLVVEAFDRLDRGEADDAYDTFKEICKCGIDIGVCETGQIYTLDDLKKMDVKIVLTIKMCMAHEYSAKLQRRMLKAYDEKRIDRKGLTKGRIKPAICPKWISLVNGESPTKSHPTVPRICPQEVSWSGSSTPPPGSHATKRKEPLRCR